MQPEVAEEGLTCRLDPCPDPEALASLWRTLEPRAEASVFLSWPWIAGLIHCFAPDFQLARIYRGDRLVALALLGQDARQSGTLFLHETGDRLHDSVMIEYNGLLAERGAERAAAAALLRHLRGICDELVLPGVAADWPALVEQQGWRCRPLGPCKPAPFAELMPLGDNDVPPHLSRNSRTQWRRSQCHFSELGPVRLRRAGTLAQALAWFDGLEALHMAHFRGKGQRGAFVEPSFGRFHRRLIEDNFDSGVTDLLCLTAGDRVLGYLYSLIWRGIAHAYQSGFDYGGDQHWRPGLVAHVGALRHYGNEGLRQYRFLAGESRFKSSLASGADHLCWLVAQRPTALRYLQATARRLKQKLDP